MRNRIILLHILLLLFGCNTAKQAEKRETKAMAAVATAYYKYPTPFTKLISQMFPVKGTSTAITTELIKGDPVIEYRYTDYNIDSLAAALKCPDSTVSRASKTVRVPCPGSEKRVDTFRSQRMDSFEDTKRIVALQLDLDQLNDMNKALQIENGKQAAQIKAMTEDRNKWRTWFWYALGIAVVYLVIKLIRFYLKIKSL